MSDAMQEFFDWRAGQLAIVHLTRCDDLRVITPRGPGDFRVEIADAGDWTGRVFGLRVRGLERAVATPDEVSMRVGEMPVMDLSGAPYPYCAAVFTNDDERGYYRWVREPVTSRAGTRLKTVRQPRWRELDHDAITEIVAAVNAWYEAQRQAQAA